MECQLSISLKYGKSLMILAINQPFLIATNGTFDQERKMNLLTVPAQAIATPSRNTSPFHAIIEHKRVIKYKYA